MFEPFYKKILQTFLSQQVFQLQASGIHYRENITH